MTFSILTMHKRKHGVVKSSRRWLHRSFLLHWQSGRRGTFNISDANFTWLMPLQLFKFGRWHGLLHLNIDRLWGKIGCRCWNSIRTRAKILELEVYLLLLREQSITLTRVHFVRSLRGSLGYEALVLITDKTYSCLWLFHSDLSLSEGYSLVLFILCLVS